MPGMSDKLLVKRDCRDLSLFKKPVLDDACEIWTYKFRIVSWALPSRTIEQAIIFDVTPNLRDHKITKIRGSG